MFTRTSFSLFFALLASTVFSQAIIAPELESAFLRGEKVDLLVVMQEQADLSGAASIHGKTQKANFVFQRLQATASRTQARVRDFLLSTNADANSFYIVNAISVKQCDGDLAHQIAAFPEVKALSADPWVKFPEPAVAPGPIAGDRAGIEWGVDKINAPAVWALGFTGQGITVGGADTGYDWTHPAITPHYRGFTVSTGTVNHNYNWHDGVKDLNPANTDPNNPCGIDIDAPCDDNNHGTHTMGTMTGDDGQGNQIGVAPGAHWVGCRNMERGWGKPSTYIDCFEWFLAPTDVNDQNPDPTKAPHVINNSWYCSEGEGCTDLTINETIRTALINLKASGVVVVVSNGNSGSQGCASTFGPPAYFEESFSVGSTQSNDTISNFSSRGPVTIDGSGRIKPNVSAPGQFVRSSIPGNNYAAFSGTSMAGPHVVGLVALILSANPALIGEVAQIEDIIEATCVPLNGLQDCTDNGGLDYPNNTYGFGRVNALAAVQEAILISGNHSPVAPSTISLFPNPAVETVFLSISNYDGEATILVTDVQGRVVVQQKNSLHTGMSVPVQMKGQAAGLYQVQIRLADGSVQNERFVLQPKGE